MGTGATGGIFSKGLWEVGIRSASGGTLKRLDPGTYVLSTGFWASRILLKGAAPPLASRCSSGGVVDVSVGGGV